jgi:hypothetical protein
MSNDFDAFERELETIRPVGISDAARRRIAHRIGRKWTVHWAQPSLRRALLAASLAGVAVLGSYLLARPLLVAVSAWLAPATFHDLVGVDPAPEPLGVGSLEAPTVQAYHRAFSDSPEALDALLALHAKQFGGSDGDAETHHTMMNLVSQ